MLTFQFATLQCFSVLFQAKCTVEGGGGGGGWGGVGVVSVRPWDLLKKHIVMLYFFFLLSCREESDLCYLSQFLFLTLLT